MTTCTLYSCQREEQCDDCFFKDHQKECAGCEHFDHEETTVAIKRIPILAISEVMNQIHATSWTNMVWSKGKILSPTKPSPNFF